MFKNIGEKIKIVAQVFTILGIITSLIIGVILILTDYVPVIVGILVIVIGSVASWLSFLTLYGFGELVENSTILARNIKRIQYSIDHPDKK